MKYICRGCLNYIQNRLLLFLDFKVLRLFCTKYGNELHVINFWCVGFILWEVVNNLFVLFIYNKILCLIYRTHFELFQTIDRYYLNLCVMHIILCMKWCVVMFIVWIMDRLSSRIFFFYINLSYRLLFIHLQSLIRYNAYILGR